MTNIPIFKKIERDGFTFYYSYNNRLFNWNYSLFKGDKLIIANNIKPSLDNEIIPLELIERFAEHLIDAYEFVP